MMFRWKRFWSSGRYPVGAGPRCRLGGAEVVFGVVEVAVGFEVEVEDDGVKSQGCKRHAKSKVDGGDFPGWTVGRGGGECWVDAHQGLRFEVSDVSGSEAGGLGVPSGAGDGIEREQAWHIQVACGDVSSGQGVRFAVQAGCDQAHTVS